MHFWVENELSQIKRPFYPVMPHYIVHDMGRSVFGKIVYLKCLKSVFPTTHMPIPYGPYELVHMMWSIWYNPYDMIHMIWSIWYDPYDTVHMIWSIWYGSYDFLYTILSISNLPYWLDYSIHLIWSLSLDHPTGMFRLNYWRSFFKF